MESSRGPSRFSIVSSLNCVKVVEKYHGRMMKKGKEWSTLVWIGMDEWKVKFMKNSMSNSNGITYNKSINFNLFHGIWYLMLDDSFDDMFWKWKPLEYIHKW